MVRLSLVVLVTACSDAVPRDEAHTCITTTTDDFERERSVSTLFAPDKPTRFTQYREERVQAHWDFTYDDAQRIVLVEQDLAVVDGVPDVMTRYEHAPTSTIEIHGSEQVSYVIDAADRVVRVDAASGATAYELGPDGEILRSLTDAIDADTAERYTQVATYRYAGGRLVERALTDTRNPSPYPPARYTYEELPHALVVRTGTREYRYTYDDEGRTIRAVDVTIPLTVDIVYAPDGAAVVTTARDGEVIRTSTLSAACAYRPVVPAVPRGQARPGTSWFLARPYIPSPS